MEPITQLSGTAVPLMRNNVDTDQIMPKQFLKRLERTGFGRYVFHEWRGKGDFVLDDARYSYASILIAGKNFGCGSSREQAVWGLLDAGIEAVIAPSFAPIFAQNAARSRLLTAQCTLNDCDRLAALVQAAPSTHVVIDLVDLRLRAEDYEAEVGLHQATRDAFMYGLDEIQRTLDLEEQVAAYEEQRHPWLPNSRL